jgi:hypothetical protein
MEAVCPSESFYVPTIPDGVITQNTNIEKHRLESFTLLDVPHVHVYVIRDAFTVAGGSKS